MSARLMDLITSPEGMLVGVSYVLAFVLITGISAGILSRIERRRMDRMITKSNADIARENAEMQNVEMRAHYYSFNLNDRGTP
jgi:hypothetical protein